MATNYSHSQTQLNFNIENLNGKDYPVAKISIKSDDYEMTLNKYNVDYGWFTTNLTDPTLNIQSVTSAIINENDPVEVTVKGKDVTLKSVVTKDEILDYLEDGNKIDLLKDVFDTSDYSKFVDMRSDIDTMHFDGYGNGYAPTVSQDRMTTFVNRFVDDGEPLSGYYVYNKIGSMVGYANSGYADNYYDMGTEGKAEMYLVIDNEYAGKGYELDTLNTMAFMHKNLHDLGYQVQGENLDMLVTNVNAANAVVIDALNNSVFEPHLNDDGNADVYNGAYGPRILFEYDLT